MSVNQIDVNAVNERTRKVHELPCTYCGEIVERTNSIKNPSCIGCKMKRHKKYGEDKRKAAKQT